MRKFTAAILFATIVSSVSVMFIDDKWVSSLSEVACCLLAAAWMVVFALGRDRPRSAPTLAAVCLVLVWGLAQICFGWTVYRWRTWLSLLYWLGNFSVLFVGIQAFSEIRIRERFLRWVTLFGFGVAVLSSLQALTTNSKIYWTFDTKYAGWVLMGPFVYHNQYAAFIELLLPVALFTALRPGSWRWFFLLVSATMYASVFIAGSRAGFLLVTAELIFVPLMFFRKRRASLFQLGAAAGILAFMVSLLAIAAGPEYLIEKFRLADPYAIRREFVESSLEMFKHRPVTGFGLGNWSVAYPAYALFDDGLYANQAHNDWAQWADEGGIPLLAIMLSLAVLTFPPAVRSIWGVGAAAIFVHCLVDYPIQRPAVALFFFSIISSLPTSLTKTQDEAFEGGSPSV